MAERPSKHGYAAFDKADAADAKRGRPAAELTRYAEERGLDFVGPRFMAGWKRAQPAFPEYMFNVMRGPLPGGGYGVLLHELFEVDAGGEGLSMSGSFHGVHMRSPGSFWKGLIPDRTDIPYIGALLDSPGDEKPPEPFGNDSVWIPCTIAAVHVPEANGFAPSLVFQRGDRLTWMAKRGGLDLSPYGVQGHYLLSEPKIGAELAERILAGPAVAIMLSWPGGYFDMSFGFGTLRLRRNGFLTQPGELDRLAGHAVALGRDLADTCGAGVARRGFDEELPPPDWEESELPIAWAQQFIDYAKRHGLEHEDPLEFHRAFPHTPAPGRAVAVMRGTLPGSTVRGRLVYYAENPVIRSQNVRGGIVVPARDGLEETPLEGVRVPEEQLVYEVRDGLVVIWSTESWGWRWAEEDTVVARALARTRADNLGRMSR